MAQINHPGKGDLFDGFGGPAFFLGRGMSRLGDGRRFTGRNGGRQAPRRGGGPRPTERGQGVAPADAFLDLFDNGGRAHDEFLGSTVTKCVLIAYKKRTRMDASPRKSPRASAKYSSFGFTLRLPDLVKNGKLKAYLRDVHLIRP